MKIIKPSKLTILQRVFEHDRKPQFVLSLLTAFHFDNPHALIDEMNLWKLAGEELTGENGILDEGQLKVRGELLVTGSCFAPRGEPVDVWHVHVSMAGIDKRLAVIGDRYWKLGVPTKPEPFTEMPVDWAHAFGGEGFDKNPRGKGYAPIASDSGKVHPLPNIESARKLINAPSDRPEPESFAALDFAWPQRRKKAGTYDDNWLRTRFPGYAADMDPTIFNAAPEDQYLPAYFDGDEAFVVENMHPERERIESQLPDLVTRAWVTQRDPDGSEHFREIAMRLDTVRLIPHQLTGVLTFRGVLPCHEDDAEDIVHVVAACELRGKPRTREHYERALALRLDKDTGAVAAITNDDLLPDVADGFAPERERADVEDWLESENLLRHNFERRREAELASSRAKMEAAGFAFPEAELQAAVPDLGDEPQDLAGMADKMRNMGKMIEDAQARAAKKREEIVTRAREAFAEDGMDFDEEMAKVDKSHRGPPKPEFEQQFALVRAMLAEAKDDGAPPMPELEDMVNDPVRIEHFRKMEAQMLEGYRHGAHMQQPVDRLELEASDLFRSEIEVAHHNDIALEDRDFSGADLSGLQLEGINLERALCEAVDLTDTNLSNATLTSAVLAHARLLRTNLRGANLSHVNLGAATIEAADMTDCKLEQATFHKTRLLSATLTGARLESVLLIEAEVGAVDFSNIVARTLVVNEIDMRQTNFAGADLTRCVFVDVDLRGVSFVGANLTETGFLGCMLDGARFCNAIMHKAALAHETTADGADFTGADMTGAMLRKLPMRGAKLDGATLDCANIASADLTGASLYRARGREALAIRTNFSGANLRGCDLLGAVLQKARLERADLEGANLFGADLARVRFDGDTKLKDANLDRARQIPRHDA